MTIISADCREYMTLMPSESVNCCVTSPPYWGLRDYGTEPLVWGGDADCEHVWGNEQLSSLDKRAAADKAKASKLNISKDRSKSRTFIPNTGDISNGQFCQFCGAWRGQLGLEPSPELYIEHLVEVFREVKRVLRKDGTLWIVIGDSYSKKSIVSTVNLKPKDLVGIPWELAFALRNDGWWLRQDIIWHKTNPQPESVRDRCTRSHEYVFLLSKSRKYYFNNESIKTPLSPKTRKGKYRIGGKKWGNVKIGEGNIHFRNGTEQWGKEKVLTTDKANRRSVWPIAIQPSKKMHFATFPERLVRLCVKAGCPEGGTVLDPFAGIGTVGKVCREMGVESVEIEVSNEYCAMANGGK